MIETARSMLPDSMRAELAAYIAALGRRFGAHRAAADPFDAGRGVAGQAVLSRHVVGPRNRAGSPATS